ATCSYAVVWLQRHPEYHGHPGKDYGGCSSCAL
ncbi:MAG TPA: GNAT family N-acetyltransferase, partial [Odoribacter splanchnicus]|nr:GNAT family N-acetyltransferase [Odoribacter splanchnicus]